uniref:Uncharacterized protein n=1 Tax=Eutreptiella gymnastica TaxID=73025 RepID=A0A7S1I1L5_9EUGL|mmetsp:Transcript_121433/g.211071  ORF Transcript_121433/g.211071 Transcript_121433/m.211071 type:complete len:130 (+) Transcript_121433:119-508(+)
MYATMPLYHAIHSMHVFHPIHPINTFEIYPQASILERPDAQRERKTCGVVGGCREGEVWVRTCTHKMHQLFRNGTLIAHTSALENAFLGTYHGCVLDAQCKRTAGGFKSGVPFAHTSAHYTPENALLGT